MVVLINRCQFISIITHKKPEMARMAHDRDVIMCHGVSKHGLGYCQHQNPHIGDTCNHHACLFLAQ
ncbi:hypothetical protein [Moraxella lacunata]|uniref:hypothetical protein n=1 Tax=Moraxella lacunata TaxID=477 RepID=UPI003EE16F2A